MGTRSSPPSAFQKASLWLSRTPSLRSSKLGLQRRAKVNWELKVSVSPKWLFEAIILGKKEDKEDVSSIKIQVTGGKVGDFITPPPGAINLRIKAKGSGAIFGLADLRVQPRGPRIVKVFNRMVIKEGGTGFDVFQVINAGDEAFTMSAAVDSEAIAVTTEQETKKCIGLEGECVVLDVTYQVGSLGRECRLLDGQSPCIFDFP